MGCDRTRWNGFRRLYGVVYVVDGRSLVSEHLELVNAPAGRRVRLPGDSSQTPGPVRQSPFPPAWEGPWVVTRGRVAMDEKQEIGLSAQMFKKLAQYIAPKRKALEMPARMVRN